MLFNVSALVCLTPSNFWIHYLISNSFVKEEDSKVIYSLVRIQVSEFQALGRWIEKTDLQTAQTEVKAAAYAHVVREQTCT